MIGKWHGDLILEPNWPRWSSKNSRRCSYNLLFRWFLDLNWDEPSLDDSPFSRNRGRLLGHDVAGELSVGSDGGPRAEADQRRALLGRAECGQGLDMLEGIRGSRQITVAGDAHFSIECRENRYSV
jgi:hypothetical protein